MDEKTQTHLLSYDYTVESSTVSATTRLYHALPEMILKLRYSEHCLIVSELTFQSHCKRKGSELKSTNHGWQLTQAEAAKEEALRFWYHNFANI